MLNSGHTEREIIILKTLNGPITLSVTKSARGHINLSINAPKDVMIYREDLSITELPINSLDAV